MYVTVIGAGYVGLTTAVCLAHKGHIVDIYDIDNTKLDKIKEGIAPFYEAGLQDLLKASLSNGSLRVTCDLETSARYTEAIFICVGTPSTNGNINLDYVKNASKEIGKALSKSADKDKYRLVVVKSTVLPGTTEDVIIPLLLTSNLRLNEHFGVCVNPEFLREGTAVNDFLNPKDVGIVIGSSDKRAGDQLAEIYRSFDAPILRTTIKSAEMIKYARNACLAKDISFVNELANICSQVGVDYDEVKKGLKLDKRIGSFVDAGIGYGGSCFPKDVSALQAGAEATGYNARFLEIVQIINDEQPYIVMRLAEKIVGELKDKLVTVLGLSFKGGSDDIRESRSLQLISFLIERGAKITVYDPKSMDNARKELSDKVTYAQSASEALAQGDIWFIATDWDEFKDINLYFSPNPKILIDGKRIIDPAKLPKNIKYQGVGYPVQLVTS